MSARDLPTLLFLAIACVFAAKSCSANDRLEEKNADLEELRTEKLEAELEAEGWQLAATEATEGLMGHLQASRDSTALLVEEKAELARQVELLGGRLLEVRDMYARARGQIVAQGEVHPTERQGVTADTEPDSISAEIDDGLLSGRLFYHPADTTLGIDPYHVDVALTAGIIEMPDGRWAPFARAADPRVEIAVERTLVEPPQPIQMCSLGQKVQTAGWTIAGWEATKSIFALILKE